MPETSPEWWFALALVVGLFLAFAWFGFTKPFIEGMREAERTIDRAEFRFPERCPMCGETTLLTRDLVCAHCGEDMRPPKHR